MNKGHLRKLSEMPTETQESYEFKRKRFLEFWTTIPVDEHIPSEIYEWATILTIMSATLMTEIFEQSPKDRKMVLAAWRLNIENMVDCYLQLEGEMK